MASKLKVLQVIPRLGYGGAETGCYDLAHYLYEQKCKSYIVTSGGELLEYIDKKKVKLIKLPVHTKNPILIIINSIVLAPKSIENIATLRAENGGTVSRLNFAFEQSNRTKSTLEAANGRIMDVDIAAESTRLAKYNILVQASASMLAQANVAPNAALMLIG